MSFDPFVLPIQLKGVTAGGVVTSAMAAEANAHTLQALIEIGYVRTGNQLLSDGLEALDTALGVTQTSLDTLATLQQLHNSVKVNSLESFNFDFDGVYDSQGDYQAQYLKWASAYFGTPIFPNFIFETQAVADAGSARGSYSSFDNFVSKLVAAKAALSGNISALRAITSAVDASGNPTNPNSLLAKLLIVYNDLPPVVSGAISYNDAKVWALDRYTAHEGQDTAQSSFAKGGLLTGSSRLDFLGNALNPLDASGNVVNPILSSYLGGYLSALRGDASKAGGFQQNIQFAVTAAQALNDSQKERVRRYLFVFEEFYKSASTLLSKITQIIEKMAQGIRPA